MDRPRAKKKVMRAPAVSASLGSTNLKADITYLIFRNYNNIEKAHSGFTTFSSGHSACCALWSCDPGTAQERLQIQVCITRCNHISVISP